MDNKMIDAGMTVLRKIINQDFEGIDIHGLGDKFQELALEALDIREYKDSELEFTVTLSVDNVPKLHGMEFVLTRDANGKVTTWIN